LIANYILRSVVDGRILLSWKPPGYYTAHPEDDRNAHTFTWDLAESSFDDDYDEEEDSSLEAGALETSAGAGVCRGSAGGSFALLLPDEDTEDEEE